MNPGLQVTVHTPLYLLLVHVVTAFAVAFGSKQFTAENTGRWSCTLTGAFHLPPSSTSVRDPTDDTYDHGERCSVERQQPLCGNDGWVLEDG